MSTNVADKKGETKEDENLEYASRLKMIDDEFISFYEYCRQAGFTEEEMEVICSPLLTTLRKSRIKRFLTVIAVVLLTSFVLYQLLQISSISIHATALARILMIKALPLWDWRYMFYETCLMKNPLYQEYHPIITEDDCNSCETLDQIDHIQNTNFDFLLANYLSRDAPVIVADAMESWSALNDDRFSSDNITQLYIQDEKLIESVPCILTSNLRTGSSDLFAFLKRIINPNVDKWFVHWQNCDINAVKALRKLYQRPYFLSNTVAPAHFNWVLMSSGYSSSIYKKIELDSGLIMLAQLKGATIFKLTPLKPCNSSCPELFGDLLPGEMLIFTNYLWNFEYYPGTDLENIAILTETVWDDNLMS